MNRWLLWIGLFAIGALLVITGAFFHFDVSSDSSTHRETLKVGLPGSPIYERVKTVSTSGNDSEYTTKISSDGSFHLFSTSTGLIIIGLACLFGAGYVRRRRAA
jgi:hypothetical protein